MKIPTIKNTLRCWLLWALLFMPVPALVTSIVTQGNYALIYQGEDKDGAIFCRQEGWSRMICFTGGDKKNIKECLQHLGIKDKISTMKSKQIPIKQEKQEDIEENALITSSNKRGILSWRN